MSRRIVASSDTISANLADEAVLLNLRSGEYFGVNSVGARVWELVQQPTNLSEILTTLRAEYDVDPAVLEQDVSAFLDHMKAQQLLEEFGD